MVEKVKQDDPLFTRVLYRNVALYFLQPDHAKVVKMVETAIDVGYRHLDTAPMYNTEPMVGEAMRNKITAGVITRDDIFLTTKVPRS